MTPAVGDTVAGRYKITGEIGSGGFSMVWRAYDDRLDREVALKCPDTSTHDSDVVQARFEREVDNLRQFSNGITPSGVVRYLDEDLDGSPQYIAFEYLPGDTLLEMLGTGRLGSGVRRRIVVDLAETLDFLHRNGVVYLDLKPENVVLRDSGRPVLLDFNTAVRLPAEIETRFEADQYKAPELLPDSDPSTEPGPWSDVFSWGKIAFYLLTGAVVPSENVPAGGIDPLDYGATCSRQLARVIERATDPDTDARYGNGPALRDAVASATRRGPRALVTHVGSDVTISVSDGDRIGRLSDDVPVPWVVLPDPEQHVSPHHARFEQTRDGWRIEDVSLNGTYVGGHDDWTHLLGEEGYRTLREQGAIDRRPASSSLLGSGSLVAPVHPEYGIELRVTIPDGNAG